MVDGNSRMYLHSKTTYGLCLLIAMCIVSSCRHSSFSHEEYQRGNCGNVEEIDAYLEKMKALDPCENYRRIAYPLLERQISYKNIVFRETRSGDTSFSRWGVSSGKSLDEKYMECILTDIAKRIGREGSIELVWGSERYPGTESHVEIVDTNEAKSFLRDLRRFLGCASIDLPN